MFLQVLVQEASNPSRVKVYGPAVDQPCKTFHPTYFMVDCSEAGPGKLSALFCLEVIHLVFQPVLCPTTSDPFVSPCFCTTSKELGVSALTQNGLSRLSVFCSRFASDLIVSVCVSKHGKLAHVPCAVRRNPCPIPAHPCFCCWLSQRKDFSRKLNWATQVEDQLY